MNGDSLAARRRRRLLGAVPALFVLGALVWAAAGSVWAAGSGSMDDSMSTPTMMLQNMSLPQGFNIELMGQNVTPSGTFLYQGHTYVPLSFVPKNLGAKGDYDADAKDVTIVENAMGMSEPGMGMSEPGMGMSEPGMGMSEPGMGMSEPGMGMSEPGMGMSESGMGMSESGPGMMAMSGPMVPVPVTVGGTMSADHLPAYVVGETVFVPLRFVAETLGYTVTWEQSTYTVTLVKGAMMQQ